MGKLKNDKDPLIILEDVSRSFGGTVGVEDLTLTIFKGDRTALLGPNGAGKSTLMKLIAGAIKPGRGKIAVAGTTPERARTRERFLGWLPERAPLNQDLSVMEHLLFAAKLRNLNTVETKRELDRLIEALNLSSKLNRLTGKLSLGSRRLVALALALLGEPELLILDEPSSSLDPDGVRRLNLVLKGLSKDTTLVISSHILDEARFLTEKLIILKNGSLASEGSWEALEKELKALENEDNYPYSSQKIFFMALEGKYRAY
jgi:ABC-2 type transport system ATP-binding protein